jgi:hypothetical protein
MNHLFILIEFADIHDIYGFFHGMSRAAVDEYHKHFSPSLDLEQEVSSDIHQSLRETEIVEHVVRRCVAKDLVQCNLTISARRMCSRRGETESPVWGNHIRSRLVCLTLQRVRVLRPDYYDFRVPFCLYIAEFCIVLFSDEAEINRFGINSTKKNSPLQVRR